MAGLKKLIAGQAVSIPPESIEPGKCYLTGEGQVHRVRRPLPDGRVKYEYRRAVEAHGWTPGGVTDLIAFACRVERPVPCDWAPENDGGGQQ